MLGCRWHQPLPPCGGLPSMARHYRAGLCALTCRAWLGTTGGMIARCSSRDDREGRPRVEPSHARLPLASAIAPLRGPAEHGSAYRAGLLRAALPSMARPTGLDCCALPCRAWLGTTGWMIARCSSRDDRAGRPRVEPSHARLPLASAIFPLRGPAEHGSALPGWIIARCPAEHGSALPGWIIARCLVEHRAALPAMQKSRLSPALLDYLPLTCLIRRRLRLIWRSVRTFFLPSYGFTPSRKMNCTGVPTSLKRLRKKFSR